MRAPPYSAARVDVLRLPGERRERDSVAVEEPLEIRVNGAAVAVTMRTPGHDEELALGFLVSEGINPQGAAPPGDLAANTIEVEAEAFDPAGLERHFYTSSSCGVCGKRRARGDCRRGAGGRKRPTGPGRTALRAARAPT
jgi:formate dehydrogenase assembly factor FdhD